MFRNTAPGADTGIYVACRFGSFLDQVELFDGVPFGVSLAEGVLLDPQQRLLLEAMAAVLPHKSDVISGSRTGVFVGISSTDYARLTARYSPDTTPYSATGSFPSRVLTLLLRRYALLRAAFMACTAQCGML